MRFLTCAVLAAAVGCNQQPARTVTTTTSTTSVQPSQQPLLSADQFDLATVTALIRENKVADVDQLQQTINDPAKGINNVDLDHDNQVDPISVRESRSADGGRVLEFVAVPTSGGDPVTIATVTIVVQTTTNQVLVQGGYPSYVAGYDQAYYSYYVPYGGPTFGQMLFLSWWLNASRPVYVYRPYYGYRPYGVRSYGALGSARTTYRTQTRINPIQRQAPPSSYVTTQRSRYAAPAVGAGLTGRAGAMRNYTPQNTSAPRPRGTAFGASPAARPAAPARPAYNPPARPAAPVRPSFSPPSRPSFSPSRPSGSSFGGRRR